MTNRSRDQKKNCKICLAPEETEEREGTVAVIPRKKDVGDGDSDAQKRTHGTLSDVVRATKKSSTPVASGTTAEKGEQISRSWISFPVC